MALMPYARDHRERRAGARELRRPLELRSDQLLGPLPIAAAETHELGFVVAGTILRGPAAEKLHVRFTALTLR